MKDKTFKHRFVAFVACDATILLCKTTHNSAERKLSLVKAMVISMSIKLLAIDGNSVLNRAFYGIRPLTTKDGVHTNAIFGFLNIMMKLCRELTPDAVAVAFDVSRRTFRHDRYDGYKATRKGMPEELAEQMPLIKEILTCMGYPVLGCEGFEGDDILGTLAAYAGENSCVIATGDRDCLQLIGDHVSVCLLKNTDNVLYDSAQVQADFGVTPKQIVELKALMGDSSDNIPGVKGIGEKTAVTLISAYGSIDSIYADVDGITATPRVKKLLAEGEDMAHLSRELATISIEAPIDHDYTNYLQSEPQLDELSKLMTRLEMFSFFEKLNLHPTAASTEAVVAEKEIIPYKIGEGIPTLDGRIYAILEDDTVKANVDGVIYTMSPDKVCGEVITYRAKPFLKRCEVTLGCDIELVAYLLNPDTKSYDIQGLATRYLTVQFDEPESDLAIRALPYLHEALTAELEQSGMTKLYNDIEGPLCTVLAEMEVEGIQVNSEGVSRFGDMLGENIEVLKALIYGHAGEEFNINSTKELARVLFEKLGLPSGKKTKTGYSTNVEVLEGLADKHEIIPAVLEYRKLSKLQSTYVVGLLKTVESDGRIHTTYNQTETRTGRISSIEPNLQNIPVRTKLGSEMRRFFVARNGYTLIDADYSQIELRILAHIADDKTMIEAFLHGDDIHAITASQVFHCPLEEMTPTLRSRAKAINFGIVYGISAFSLANDIGVSFAEAKAYIEAYLATYHGVAEYMERIIKQARSDEYVSTLYGRRRPLADINNSNKQIKAFAERVALNAPIQGTAADIIKLAMVRVQNRLKHEGLDARLILQVHDELIVEAPVMQAEQIKLLLREEMESAATLAVPLLVDVGTGDDWYTAHQ